VGDVGLAPCLEDLLLEADMPTLLTACVAKITANDPEEATVSITRSETTTVLEFKVGPQDQGPFIGRDGQVLRSLRILARAMMGSKMSNHTVVVNKTKDERTDRHFDDRYGDQG
jgi:predicted RNA-binding protein YlqC (UPF0109 family)